MAYRLPDLKPATTIPGPGAYDSSTSKASLEISKSLKFGKEARGKMESPNAKLVPGPGNHSPNFSVTKYDSPKYRFGSSTRNSLNRTIAPGPGQYQTNSFIGEGPKNSIHQRLTTNGPIEKPKMIPGPGAYE
jgi:hypothetical protein